MSMHVLYILDDQRRAVAVSNADWVQWMASHEHEVKIVKQETVEGAFISTVFLAIDHSFGRGPPMLFETMVFRDGVPAGDEMARCSTWEEAEAQHASFVTLVRVAHQSKVKGKT